MARRSLLIVLMALFAGVACAATTPEGRAFLESNKLKEGVVTLASGGNVTQVTHAGHVFGYARAGAGFDARRERPSPARVGEDASRRGSLSRDAFRRRTRTASGASKQ